MKSVSQIFSFAFVVTALAEIYSRYADNAMLHLVAKPLLMIVLLAFFYVSLKGRSNKTTKLIMWGLVFAWIGDVLLMFESPEQPLFFMGGLGAFLTTHVLYILAFNASVTDPSRSIFKTRIIAIVPFILIGGYFYYELFPELHELQIPVGIYTAVIVTMVIFALNRIDSVNVHSFRLVYYGAIIFMLSDLLLAINKFMLPFDHADVYIIGTYILAQGLIVSGVLVEAPAE
jgi:uncharacterized membrane protein YhhN